MQSTKLNEFAEQLKFNEKSAATVRKYVRDVNEFLMFLKDGREISDGIPDGAVTKEAVLSYKRFLLRKYAVSSVNSMLAALNSYLNFIGREDCVVKSVKVQRDAFRPKEKELTKEEYKKLLIAAEEQNKEWLCQIMRTICATGIRISELPFITVKAVRDRRAQVSLKGKKRTVLLPEELCRELETYARKLEIDSGPLFVTKGGLPIDRSNILHAMKKLCEEAGVSKDKVFPHNLRHLFAVTYYNAERDICHLADILGHSNINTTRIYTMVSCEEQQNQIERLDLVCGGKGGNI